MARKKATRKSRMDILLESMDAAAQGTATTHLSAAAFLAQSSSDEEDALDDQSAVESPSYPLPTSPKSIDKPPAQRGRRIERKQSLGVDDSQDSCSSSPLFMSELGMRQRKRDKEIENILYEAENVGASKSGPSLCSLIRTLSENTEGSQLFDSPKATKGPSHSEMMARATKSLSMIRTSGTSMTDMVLSLTQPFFNRAGQTSDTIIKYHLAFLRLVFGQCAVETLLKPQVHRFLIEIFRHGVNPTAKVEIPLATPVAPARKHWSLLLASSPSSSAITDTSAEIKEGEAELYECLSCILPAGALDELQPLTLTSAAADLLTFVLITANRQSLFGGILVGGGQSSGFLESQGSDFLDVGAAVFSSDLDSSTKSASIMFHQCKGFHACLEALRSSSTVSETTVTKVLGLLEVATCNEALKGDKDLSSVLKDILLAVFELMKSDTTREVALRVATNITGVCPEAIPSDKDDAYVCATQLSNMMSVASPPQNGTKMVANIDVGRLCELVCLAVNFCKRGTNEAFRWSLMGSMSDDFCGWAASWLQALYEVEDNPAANVLAGYLALLLGMLSLRNELARVKVVTSLSLHAATSVASVIKKPMTWIVAVLQEFVLFHSSVEILTKDMVVAMHAIIDALIEENGITVSK